MQGRYHLLKYENWNYESLYSIFDYNQALSGKPKRITVEKKALSKPTILRIRLGPTLKSSILMLQRRSQ